MSYHEACNIVEILQKKGFCTYFAGGWVRDFLLGIPSNDIDIVTEANVEQLQAIFPHTIPVGIAFGILIVKRNGHLFEVASFRKDRTYLDGRRPSGIDKADPFEDAQRRDFTINGLFFDPGTESVIDYVGGREDLVNRQVRAIGDPDERFKEDRLRMLRAVRFACKFRFAIEERTAAAICRHAHTLFPAVAVERVWQELEKIAKDRTLGAALSELDRLQLLPYLFEVYIDRSCFHALPGTAELILQLFPLFAQFQQIEWEQFCKRWKRSRRELQLVQLTCQMQNTEDDWLWASFFAKEESATILPLLEKLSDDPSQIQERQKRLHPHIERLRQKKPLLTISDLIALGVPSHQLHKCWIKAQALSVRYNLHAKEKLLPHLKCAKD